MGEGLAQWLLRYRALDKRDIEPFQLSQLPKRSGFVVCISTSPTPLVGGGNDDHHFRAPAILAQSGQPFSEWRGTTPRNGMSSLATHNLPMSSGTRS
jgi:hypothetical protein